MTISIHSLTLQILLCFSMIGSVCTARADEIFEETNLKRLHLVVIGVSKFSDSFWPDLKWAASDAKAFSEKIGAGTDYKKGISLFINEDATLSAIRFKLKAVASTARENDVVLLYISSHGTLRKGPENTIDPVVVLHDSSHTTLARSSLPHSELRSWLSAIKSRRKAIVLATCHSGVGKSKFTEEIREFKRGEKGKTLRSLESISEGSLILAASARNETALESDDLKADVYSHFLLESLDAGDKNSDGAVSLLEAHDYARLRTYAFTKGRQRPTVEAQMIGDADFPIKGRRSQSGKPILEAYSSKYEGYFVGIGKGEPVELPTALPLTNGENTVVVTEPTLEYERRFLINANQGEQVSLDDLLQPQPYWFSAALINSSVSDARFKKVTGSKDFFDSQVRLGVRKEIWSAAALYNFGRNFSTDPLPNLRSTLSHSAAGVEIGMNFAPLSALPKIEIHPITHILFSKRKLTFKDNTTTETFSSNTTSVGIGYGLAVSAPITFSSPTARLRPILLDVAFYRTHELESNFIPFGKLDISSLNGRIGLTIHFGGKGLEI